MTKRVSGSSQGELNDAAEKWLRDNDPNYRQSKRAWTSPSTDALPRALHASNEPHASLEDLDGASLGGDGAYRRRNHRFSDGDDVSAPRASVVDNIATFDDADGE